MDKLENKERIMGTGETKVVQENPIVFALGIILDIRIALCHSGMCYI